jgi:hypothetical protein
VILPVLRVAEMEAAVAAKLTSCTTTYPSLPLLSTVTLSCFVNLLAVAA